VRAPMRRARGVGFGGAVMKTILSILAAFLGVTTGVNEGGIVMDRLISGCQPGSSGGRILTDITSVSALGAASQAVADPARAQIGRGRGDGKSGLVRHAR
jgi:hypothetical protein